MFEKEISKLKEIGLEELPFHLFNISEMSGERHNSKAFVFYNSIQGTMPLSGDHYKPICRILPNYLDYPSEEYFLDKID